MTKEEKMLKAVKTQLKKRIKEFGRLSREKNDLYDYGHKAGLQEAVEIIRVEEAEENNP